MVERKHQQIGKAHEAPPEAKEAELVQAIDEDVGDDVLRLILVACHPVLSTDARVALTLRLLGGLSTEEIARAFLLSEATVAQRIVRAKRTLSEARVPFEVPRGAALSERLPSVLEVVYLIFHEGYSATKGDDWLRVDLCQDAMRLGRILAERVHAVAGALAQFTPESSFRAVVCSHAALRSLQPGERQSRRADIANSLADPPNRFRNRHSRVIDDNRNRL